MLCEVNDLAGQHEVIAENLRSDVINEIHCLVKDIKDERKKVHNNIVITATGGFSIHTYYNILYYCYCCRFGF